MHAHLSHACWALEGEVSLCDIKPTFKMPLPTEWTLETGRLELPSIGRNQIVGEGFLSELRHQHLAQCQLPAMDLHFHRALTQAHLRGNHRVGQLLNIASNQHLARGRRK